MLKWLKTYDQMLCKRNLHRLALITSRFNCSILRSLSRIILLADHIIFSWHAKSIWMVLLWAVRWNLERQPVSSAKVAAQLVSRSCSPSSSQSSYLVLLRRELIAASLSTESGKLVSEGVEAFNPGHMDNNGVYNYDCALES